MELLKTVAAIPLQSGQPLCQADICRTKVARSSSFSREARKGNAPFFKFQQVMKNIKTNKQTNTCRLNKTPMGPEVVSLGAATLHSVIKLVSFLQKWQEMKRERLAGVT